MNLKLIHTLSNAFGIKMHFCQSDSQWYIFGLKRCSILYNCYWKLFKKGLYFGQILICFQSKIIAVVRDYKIETFIALLPISGFVLDKKFQRNASKFAIFWTYENPKLLFPFFHFVHIETLGFRTYNLYVRKPKVAFSVFHFVLLYSFP